MADRTPAAVISEVRSGLRAKTCWHVGCGAAVGPTFSLALGEKIAREIPLRNQAVSDEFRRFTGESNVYVWCTWRLDTERGPISSSDDDPEHIETALSELIGESVADSRVNLPGWDLHLEFSNGHVLHVFCDHVPGEPSFDGNWELELQDRVIEVGVGSKCVVKPR